MFNVRYLQRKAWVNILVFLDKLPIDVGDVVEDEPPVGEVDHADSTDGSPAYRVGYPARNGDQSHGPQRWGQELLGDINVWTSLNI